MRGVSLAEVSSATRISTKFLEAIENGKWDELPGGAFNRGYIRSTSRYLGLDEDGMVAEYALETNGNGAHVAPRTSSEVPRVPRHLALRIAAIAGAIIVLVALAWLATTRISGLLHGRRHAADAAVPAPATALQPPAELSSPPLQLVVRASSPTVVRVSADGKSVLDRHVSANDEYQFSARDGFNVEAGDAGAVHLELNGQPVPPIGPTGRHGSVTLTAKDLKSSAGGTH